MLFTKLRAWDLTQYDKVLLLDSDIILLRPLDELFAWCTPPDAPVSGWDIPPADLPPHGAKALAAGPG